ncbi:hypothetical protein E4U54_005977 [Claviceps lovelessii]|nr:hypothetical protein E4U54_005977 [Claviceps lovelessii]
MTLRGPERRGWYAEFDKRWFFASLETSESLASICFDTKTSYTCLGVELFVGLRFGSTLRLREHPRGFTQKKKPTTEAKMTNNPSKSYGCA